MTSNVRVQRTPKAVRCNDGLGGTRFRRGMWDATYSNALAEGACDEEASVHDNKP